MMRRIRFAIETALVRLFLGLFGRMRPETASAVGGALARAVGRVLPVSRTADRNLRLAMPELDAAARRRIVIGVWDNLGRTAAEFVHVRALRRTARGPGFEIAGEEHVRAVLEAGGPAIFVSAHIANWEVISTVFSALGTPLGTFYRAATNPEVDAIILAARSAGGVPQFRKGAQGARASLAHLQKGGLLGALADQKMNNGIAVTLFGHTAMTAPAPAALALRFGCKLVPINVERLGPARMRVTFEAPLPHPDSGDRTADVAELTQQVNYRIEAWVRNRPEQWLWLHRRWPKEIMP